MQTAADSVPSDMEQGNFGSVKGPAANTFTVYSESVLLCLILYLFSILLVLI